MIVAGVMSGTSADGVDVALCRISAGRGETPKIKLLGHTGLAYPKALRAAVLAAMDAKAIPVAELARLNWRLGEVYADAVVKACAAAGVRTSAVALRTMPTSRNREIGHPRLKLEVVVPKVLAGMRLALVGCHGQTVYHQGAAQRYLGRPLRATWQMGEASVVAESLRVPVVSDFRPADLAAGGQGAPLVPMLDFCMFRSAKVSRVLQNLGGIGNLTAIPAGAGVDGVMAFDTGPANMVIDGCMKRLYGREFDRGGAVAGSGKVLRGVVDAVIQEAYFSALPPKSCGREQFGEAFVARFVERCRRAASGVEDADVVATATALTSASVVDAYRRFVWAHVGRTAPLAKVEFVMAGGGAKNLTLMKTLGEELGRLGVKVRRMEELGVPAQAKEAVAFALLAWLTWHRRPGNLPAATGARRPVVLGKVSLG